MTSMTFDDKTAKSLCTAEEFKMFQKAQTGKREALTVEQLKALVTRSREARNKWTDVSRRQRRVSQTAKGHRQGIDNARSTNKALLLSEVHQAFVDRLTAVEKSGSSSPTSKKAPGKSIRSDRKIEHRATRSINRGDLKIEKRRINRSSQSKETSQGAPASPQSVVDKATASKKISKKKSSTKAKAAASAKGVKKKATATAARKKLLAQKANPANTSRRPQSKSRNSNVTELSKSERSARNLPLRIKSTKEKIAEGGGTRIRGHVSGSGKRSQAHRDSR